MLMFDKQTNRHRGEYDRLSRRAAMCTFLLEGKRKHFFSPGGRFGVNLEKS